MDALRSWQFVYALACFLMPTAIAAGFVYRRIMSTPQRRQRARGKLTDARIQRLVETTAPAEPPPAALVPVAQAPAPPAPVAPAAQPDLRIIQQTLENLRERLVAFRASIQETNSAFKRLQDCDVRCSMDLHRLSETIERVYRAEAASVAELSPRDISSAA